MTINTQGYILKYTIAEDCTVPLLENPTDSMTPNTRCFLRIGECKMNILGTHNQTISIILDR